MNEHSDMPTEHDLRGSAPVMTAKELLLELWQDMKVVRPIAEELKQADILQRVVALELDHAVRDARGGAPPTLVERVEALEEVNEADLASRNERRRIAGLTNKGLALIVLVSNFIVGSVVLAVQLIKAITG